MTRFLIGFLLVPLAGCGEEPLQTVITRYDDHIKLITRTSTYGGALGSDVYRISYSYKGKEEQIFKGEGARRFAVAKSKGRVIVTFCGGQIEYTSNFYIDDRPDDSDATYIQLDLRTYCPDLT